MDKKQARRAGLQARAALSLDMRKEYGKRIFQKLIPNLDTVHIIGCYISVNDEVDTHSILQYAYMKGITVTVPVIYERTLHFYTIGEDTKFGTGIGGIPEPMTGTVIKPDEIDLMIVPLSSFDDHCMRTGYGKGYYDSILSKCRNTVGLAYSVQHVDLIRADPWDVALERIITEVEIFSSNKTF